MKKIIGLVISLTIISGACAAVLAYVNSITAEPIKATAEKAKEAAKLAVLCGEEGYTAEGRSSEGYGGDIVLMVGFKKDKKTVSLKVKKDGGEIEAITSATITSRAVCKAIADAQKKLQ